MEAQASPLEVATEASPGSFPILTFGMALWRQSTGGASANDLPTALPETACASWIEPRCSRSALGSATRDPRIRVWHNTCTPR